MDGQIPQVKPVVVAVSGGLDSVVLLDLLAKQMPPEQLVVAHFDHGIRPESGLDAIFVAGLAKKYGLRFVTERRELGPHASEAIARKARYDFLHRVRTDHDAHAVVTAHHQDDVLETAALNLLRGTGRRGLSSLKSTDTTWRPLTGYSKASLRDYALSNGLTWHEDATNHDTKYRRNYIRNVLIPQAEAKDPAFRTKLLSYINQAAALNQKADALLEEWLDNASVTDNQMVSLKRHDFVMLTHAEAKEVLQLILRRLQAKEFSKKTLERLAIAAKAGKPFSSHDVCCHVTMSVAPDAKLIFGTRH